MPLGHLKDTVTALTNPVETINKIEHEAPNWLTGVQAPCKEKQAAFRYRNEVFGRAIPLSALSALIVIVINYCRRNNVMTWLFGSNIAHPYAAQVHLIYAEVQVCRSPVRAAKTFLTIHGCQRWLCQRFSFLSRKTDNFFLKGVHCGFQFNEGTRLMPKTLCVLGKWLF